MNSVTDSISIGNIHFQVASSTPIAFHKRRDHYQSFRAPLSQNSDSIQVRIEYTPAGDLRFAEGDPLFKSGESWSVRRKEDERWVVFHPPPFKRPLWSFRLGSDFDHVTIYYGDELLRQREGAQALLNPFVYPLDQILTMVILAGRLKGVIVHAAGGARGGQGFLFPGRSGAGKSTITDLLVKGSALDPLSDDRLIVRAAGRGMDIYGTPWPGTAGIARNERAPLRGILFLKKSDSDRIEPMTPSEALEQWVVTTSIPWFDPGLADNALKLCEEITSRVPAGTLHFKKTGNVGRLLEDWCAELKRASG